MIEIRNNYISYIHSPKMLVGNEKRRYREIGESLDSKVRVCESLNLTPTRSTSNLG